MISNNHDKLSKLLLQQDGVDSVSDIALEGGLIDRIILRHSALGLATIRRIRVKDAPALFDLYFNGLSEQSRRFFGAPYPLFIPPLDTSEELANRIEMWQREEDWTMLLLMRKDVLAGLCMLKRYLTQRPVTGIALREEFRGMQLGTLMQRLINEQARMLGVTRLWSGAAQDNIASLRLHEKCGFKRTGKLVPHYCVVDGKEVFDRDDVDLVNDLI